LKKIKYTPDAADKLRELKKAITQSYGADKAIEIVKKITDAIRELGTNEKKGPAVSQMFDVDTDYRFLFISHNYVFYRIVNFYHEREDFMWKLFGIETVQQETLDYWNE
jgi:plasmid stabilization system protein ParE